MPPHPQVHMALRHPFREKKGRRSYSGPARDVNGASVKLQREGAVLARIIKVLVACLALCSDYEYGAQEVVVVGLIQTYVHVMGERVVIRPPVVHKVLTFGAFVPFYCGTDYRFRTREDLQQLYALLEIPDQVGPFEGSGGMMPGEKVFIYMLRRLASEQTVDQIVGVVGGDPTAWGRASNWLFRWLAARWDPLLTSFPQDMVRRFPHYANRIATTANKHRSDPQFNVDTFNVCAFIDCNITPTCRAGTGPAEAGPGAPRRDPAGNVTGKGATCARARVCGACVCEKERGREKECVYCVCEEIGREKDCLYKKRGTARTLFLYSKTNIHSHTYDTHAHVHTHSPNLLTRWLATDHVQWMEEVSRGKRRNCHRAGRPGPPPLWRPAWYVWSVGAARRLLDAEVRSHEQET